METILSEAAYKRVPTEQKERLFTSPLNRGFSYATRLGAADQRLLGNPEIRGPLVQAMAESFRQGGEAGLEAALAEVRPWGFQVEQVTFENLFVWHGEQDRIMPVAPVRLLVQALPHCTATFYPDQGHFSTLANHVQDIWSRLRI